MFDVTVTNNYANPLFVAGKKIADPKGGKASLAHFSNQAITVPGMGDINFVDLGDKKLSDYTNPKIKWTEFTWGGLVRYRGLDAYFRYEGGGLIQVTVDELGSVALHFAQGGMIVRLDDMTVV